MRITVQLIKTDNDHHLWADTYDGKYTVDVLAFQSDVAQKIAQALKVVLTPGELKRVKNKSTSEIMAWDLVLRGMEMQNNYLASLDKSFLESAQSFYNRALTIDHNYSGALYGKGYILLLMRKLDSAMYYAEKAIEFGPEDMYGYHLKGVIHANTLAYRNPDLAIEYLSKAIELAPNESQPTMDLGLVYCNQKKEVRKGLSLIARAIILGGPGQEHIYNRIGFTFLSMGDYERSTEYYRKTLEMQVAALGVMGYSRTLLLQGKYEKAKNFLDSLCAIAGCERCCNLNRFRTLIILEEYEEAERTFNLYIDGGGELYGSDKLGLSLIHHYYGREKEALTILDTIQHSTEARLSKLKTVEDHLLISQVYAFLDEKEKALDHLSESVNIGLLGGWHDLLEIHPCFKNLRDDPEFKAIVKRAQVDKAAIRAQVQEMEEQGELNL